MTSSLDTTTTQLTDHFGSLRLKLNVPLSGHCYMKVGGPADILIQVNNQEELTTAYSIAKKNHTPVFILGSGSNILISDKGIRGLVIKNRADHIKTINFQGGVKHQTLKLASATIEAESGAITNHLVRYSIDQGLAGLEYFLGLPGTVGGAIYNNSHYQHQMFGDYVKEVKVLNRRLQVKTYTQSELKFGYDTSLLQRTKELILSATFFLEGGDQPSLWTKATEFAKTRSATQPLSFPSSGCMFQNLTDSESRLLGLSHHSAGYLIDNSGLKGYRIGGAVVSDKHANFIINTGTATASDIKKLISHVKRTVKAKFGITLRPEVFFVGEK